MTSRSMTMGLAAVMLLAACTVESTGSGEGDDGDDGHGDDDDGGDDGIAPAGDIEQCKSSCNQLKFFDCNDSQQHSLCFTACEEASQDEIELFVACVQADICDATCFDDLVGAAPPPDPPEPAGCVDACESILADGCYDVPASQCAPACGSFSADQQAFIVYCDARRSGCDFPDECDGLFEEESQEVTEGGGGGGGDLEGGDEVTGGGPDGDATTGSFDEG